jgi:Peptidase family M50
MGPSSSEFPDLRFPPLDPARGALSDGRSAAEAFPPEEPIYAAPARVVRRTPESKRRYLVLFALTALTTTATGAGAYAGFLSDFGRVTFNLSTAGLIANAFWYSASIIAILGAHEFGHYFACRYYGVDASLPYFLPLPPSILIGGIGTGTAGAVIRIREPITTKTALFDIGIAGPIAGFLVAVPVLFLGMHLSTVVPLPPRMVGYNLGEPLLFQVTRWLTFGSIPAGSDVNLHPMAFAAWFGLIATAINLFPIGQLDGGHISYAVLGGRISTAITVITVACLVGLTVFVSWSWVVWTVITIGMLILFGPRHPRTLDDHEPIDRRRVWLAAFALFMFVVCFTPAPIEPMTLVRPRPRPSSRGLQAQSELLTTPSAGRHQLSPASEPPASLPAPF